MFSKVHKGSFAPYYERPVRFKRKYRRYQPKYKRCKCYDCGLCNNRKSPKFNTICKRVCPLASTTKKNNIGTLSIRNIKKGKKSISKKTIWAQSYINSFSANNLTNIIKARLSVQKEIMKFIKSLSNSFSITMEKEKSVSILKTQLTKKKTITQELKLSRAERRNVKNYILWICNQYKDEFNNGNIRWKRFEKHSSLVFPMSGEIIRFDLWDDLPKSDKNESKRKKTHQPLRIRKKYKKRK